MSSIVRRTKAAGRAVTPRQVAMARFLRQRATPAEAALWEALRHRRLAGLRFRRQHKVAGFIVDFFCPKKRLVVEVDGPIHERQREADAARDTLLRATGYQVLHVTNDAVLENITAVLAIIRTTAYSPSPSVADGDGAGG